LEFDSNQELIKHSPENQDLEGYFNTTKLELHVLFLL